MKRISAIILALVLTLALLPPPAQAESSPAFGSEVWFRDTALQNGVTYSENIFWSSGYDKPRHEYYFTYTPGIGGNLPSAWTDAFLPTEDLDDPFWIIPEQFPDDDTGDIGDVANGWLPEGLNPLRDVQETGVRPVASYGNSVCGRSTVSEAAKKYESMGYRVVGAINGDFYDMATGYPLGILVSDGELLSGANEYYAVGFRADGSVVMGTPSVRITATSSGGSLELASLNKPRVDMSGVTMITSGFRDDHTTGSSVASDGVNVLATVISGRTSIGETMTIRVDEVAEDALTRTLAENQVLLTGASDGYDTGLAFLRALVPGETVTISVSAADPNWNDVTEAIGAYYSLVENGVPQEGFEVSAAPRTAVGVKADGDLILYTLDGRQDSVSMGASLGVLAQRMAELGCVTALCLDGGGSTTAVAATPDVSNSKLLNSPSDKSQRSVSNHLLLLAPGGATGIPDGVTLSAEVPTVLAGHAVKLSANVTDTHYYPIANLPVDLTTDLGEIQDGSYLAPAYGGHAVVTATYGPFSTQRDILVIDAPSSMVIQYAGSSSVNVIAGGTAQMSLTAYYNHRTIEISNTDVTWSVDPSLGTIDADGLFTASPTAASGVITATIGNTDATIQVTVEANHPFVDLDGHWAESYMGRLYQQKILNGEIGTDGQLYVRPERGLSRAEFSVLLSRYLNLDTSEYAEKEIPFTDIGNYESWAGNAIRAMYALGIVNGVDSTHFSPSGSLTRAQAAAMLGRALGLTEEPDPVEEPDTDVTEPNVDITETDVEPVPELPPEPSEEPVEEPTPEPEPVPEMPLVDDAGVDPANRSDSAISDRLRGSVKFLQLLSLSDYPDADQIPEYAEAYFRILESKGALTGRDGQLVPTSPITRAEICKALVVMEND